MPILIGIETASLVKHITAAIALLKNKTKEQFTPEDIKNFMQAVLALGTFIGTISPGSRIEDEKKALETLLDSNEELAQTLRKGLQEITDTSLISAIYELTNERNGQITGVWEEHPDQHSRDLCSMLLKGLAALNNVGSKLIPGWECQGLLFTHAPYINNLITDTFGAIVDFAIQEIPKSGGSISNESIREYFATNRELLLNKILTEILEKFEKNIQIDATSLDAIKKSIEKAFASIQSETLLPEGTYANTTELILAMREKLNSLAKKIIQEYSEELDLKKSQQDFYAWTDSLAPQYTTNFNDIIKFDNAVSHFEIQIDLITTEAKKYPENDERRSILDELACNLKKEVSHYSKQIKEGCEKIKERTEEFQKTCKMHIGKANTHIQESVPGWKKILLGLSGALLTLCSVGFTLASRKFRTQFFTHGTVEVDKAQLETIKNTAHNLAA